MTDEPDRSLPSSRARAPSQKKRVHLPVVQSAGGDEDDDEQKPPWQWAVLGCMATFFAWLPIAGVTVALTRGVVLAGPSTLTLGLVGAAHALGFALATFLGGLLVGRFGGTSGPREASIGGALAASSAFVLLIGQVPARIALLLAIVLPVLALGLGVGRLGGRAGVALRPKAARRA